MSRVITLTSSDAQKITIDEKSAERSELLKGLLQDYTENSDVSITEIKGEVLKKIVEYLTHYKETDPKEIPKPLPSANLLDVTDEWDVTYINSVDLDTVIDIIQGANFMDIKPLLHLACAKVASIMTQSSAKEIQRIFNIECDLTEQELKEYEEYEN